MLASTSVLPTAPSVLAPPYHTLDTSSPSSFEGLSTALPEGAAALAKRQRVTMACQYCRHRKIRCCGGAPCRNCARSQRECEYSPVPEIVNRASREKKAMARAVRFGLATPPPGSFPYYTPSSSYSPYPSEASVFDGPYSSVPAPTGHFQTPPPHSITMPAAHARPNAAMSHRRSVSVPNLEAHSWIEATPAAPQLDSPAQFESPQWMYGTWSPAAAAAAAAAQPTSTNQQSSYPSVLDQPVSHLSLNSTDNLIYATPSTTHQRYRLPLSHRSSGSGIEEYNHAWSTPPVLDQYSTMTPGMNSSPVSPEFYTPFTTHHNPYQYYSQPPTPALSYPAPPPQPVFTRHEANAVINLNCDSISPTLAPELSNSISSRKSLVGLGIGMGAVNRHTPDMFAGPTMTLSEDYFSVPAAVQGGY